MNVNISGNEIRIKGRLVRVGCLDGEKYTFPDDPPLIVDQLKRAPQRVDIFTFIQPVPETSPKYGYHMEWDNLAVLPISTFDHWWTHQIKSYPRNRARQAEKRGVLLREIPCDEALFRGICEIYNETPIRQGRRFPYYGMNIDGARKYASTFLDRSIYVGAFVGETMIGFIKLVLSEARTHACLVHILSMLKHKDKAPTNALIAYAVRACADRSIPHLVYENFTYGNKTGDSLSHFKEVNGFKRMDLPRYYVPLTPWGAAALRLGLHHRFVDRIPESLAAKFREFRKNWYDRRFQSVSEA